MEDSFNFLEIENKCRTIIKNLLIPTMQKVKDIEDGLDLITKDHLRVDRKMTEVDFFVNRNNERLAAVEELKPKVIDFNLERESQEEDIRNHIDTLQRKILQSEKLIENLTIRITQSENLVQEMKDSQESHNQSFMKAKENLLIDQEVFKEQSKKSISDLQVFCTSVQEELKKTSASVVAISQDVIPQVQLDHKNFRRSIDDLNSKFTSQVTFQDFDVLRSEVKIEMQRTVGLFEDRLIKFRRIEDYLNWYFPSQIFVNIGDILQNVVEPKIRNRLARVVQQKVMKMGSTDNRHILELIQYARKDIMKSLKAEQLPRQIAKPYVFNESFEEFKQESKKESRRRNKESSSNSELSDSSEEVSESQEDSSSEEESNDDFQAKSSVNLEEKSHNELNGSESEVNMKNIEEIIIKGFEEVNMKGSEEVNIKDVEEISMKGSEEINMKDSEEINMKGSEEINMKGSEEINMNIGLDKQGSENRSNSSDLKEDQNIISGKNEIETEDAKEDIQILSHGKLSSHEEINEQEIAEKTSIDILKSAENEDSLQNKTEPAVKNEYSKTLFNEESLSKEMIEKTPSDRAIEDEKSQEKLQNPSEEENPIDNKETISDKNTEKNSIKEQKDNNLDLDEPMRAIEDADIVSDVEPIESEKPILQEEVNHKIESNLEEMKLEGKNEIQAVENSPQDSDFEMTKEELKEPVKNLMDEIEQSERREDQVIFQAETPHLSNEITKKRRKSSRILPQNFEETVKPPSSDKNSKDSESHNDLTRTKKSTQLKMPVEKPPQISIKEAAPQIQPKETAPQIQLKETAPQIQPKETAPQIQSKEAVPQIKPKEDHKFIDNLSVEEIDLNNQDFGQKGRVKYERPIDEELKDLQKKKPVISGNNEPTKISLETKDKTSKQTDPDNLGINTEFNLKTEKEKVIKRTDHMDESKDLKSKKLIGDDKFYSKINDYSTNEHQNRQKQTQEKKQKPSKTEQIDKDKYENSKIQKSTQKYPKNKNEDSIIREKYRTEITKPKEELPREKSTIKTQLIPTKKELTVKTEDWKPEKKKKFIHSETESQVNPKENQIDSKDNQVDPKENQINPKENLQKTLTKDSVKKQQEPGEKDKPDIRIQSPEETKIPKTEGISNQEPERQRSKRKHAQPPSSPKDSKHIRKNRKSKHESPTPIPIETNRKRSKRSITLSIQNQENILIISQEISPQPNSNIHILPQNSAKEPLAPKEEESIEVLSDHAASERSNRIENLRDELLERIQQIEDQQYTQSLTLEEFPPLKSDVEDILGSSIPEIKTQIQSSHDELSTNITILSHEVNKLLKTRKTIASDVLEPVNKLKAIVNEKLGHLSIFDKQISGLNSSVNSLNEFCRGVVKLLTQDEEDKQGIQLTGFSEAKNHKRVVSFKPDCLSCSGNNPTVINAFKIACLNYSPSPVKVGNSSYTRRNFLHLIGSHVGVSVGTFTQSEEHAPNEKRRRKMNRSQMLELPSLNASKVAFDLNESALSSCREFNRGSKFS